jgi:hypothetical protein
MREPVAPEPITWSIPFASAMWGVSETTGRDLARRGLFPGAFKVPGTRRWLVHVATFHDDIARLARGLPIERGPDRILIRALDEGRLRQRG